MGMNNKLIMLLSAATLCCSAVHARTLTFDDVPSETDLGISFLYYHDYRVSLGGFQAIDHADST